MEQKLRRHIRPSYKKHNGEYCWICCSRDCKDPKRHEDLQEAANRIKLRSKIWCAIRSDWNHNLLNVGMSCDCLDKPIAYSCGIGPYEIVQWANSKKLEVYKKRYVKDIPKLHYYWYVSPGVQKIFDDYYEQLPQEELARVANKDWSKCPNFVKNKTNLACLREMKRKYIKCLEYDKQIIWRDSQQKYVAYKYYDFCIKEGYSF